MEFAPAARAREDVAAAIGGAIISRAELAPAIEMFRFMQMSREVDRVEMELVNRGEGFFHVGGAGHEATVALHRHLRRDDWLHPHYRDKALLMARGLPPDEFFHGLLATIGSASQGRQMCAHLSAPALNILTMAGPVGNSSLQSVGVAQEIVSRQMRSGVAQNGSGKGSGHGSDLPLVFCALGDSASQQGEFLEAVAEAVRARLPVLFLIEDNGYGISTRTAGNTFYHLPSGPQDSFYGLPIHRMDGRDALACSAAFGPIIAAVRTGTPAIVVMEMERLTHHTNADDERVYRDPREIQRVRREGDPIARLRDRLLASGVTESELRSIEADVERTVRAAADRSLISPNPVANRDARPPAAVAARAPGPVPGAESPSAGTSMTMLEAMREVLRRHLASDPAVTLFGEDIEDPKGDVFGLTRGLTHAYPTQVKNSALTESTILGVSVGRAMAGGRPVAFIQFADFLPLAFNQIAAELSTIYWRSNGGWKSPVIVLAPCGGYRPGLGPFHAQTFDSTLAHLPGIDVVVPSTAADAAGLLNAAFANQATGRPTVVLYPKACLNDPGVSVKPEGLDEIVQPGKARVVRAGDSVTLVGWGSTVSVCLDAARQLETAGVSAEVIDLRSLSPWDPDTVRASAERTGRLVVVHEDNLTGGFGGEVVSAVVESARVPVRCRRVARPDTHVPFNYLNQLELLPGVPEVLSAVAELCDLEVTWKGEAARGDGVHVLEAVGSSPADQTVSVVEWRVKEGDTIRAGDLIADCEADKATFELRAPVGGVIRDLLAVDEKVPVGTPMARIQTEADGKPATVRRVPVTRIPTVVRRAGESVRPPGSGGPAARGTAGVFVPAPALGRDVVVGLSSIAAVPASRVVTNEEMIQRFPGRTADDILQRTGILSRRLLGPGESALSLAAAASRKVLSGMGLRLKDLDAIVVSTSTPVSISPSMACLLHHELSRDGDGRDVAASDILAACTGYLYALQTAFDFCRSKPDANILVVTAEAMSEYTDPNDFDTAIVFGDAATATLVHGPSSGCFGAARAHLHRPVLSARGEDGTILHHGRRGNPNVNMDGLKVFPMAVRQLIALLKQACAEGEIAVEDLDYIIPHQANGRILDAVDQRLKLPKGRLVNRVAHSGNTSSSTIPLVLSELLQEKPKGKAGLCAFGGGFTFGAAVMEWV